MGIAETTTWVRAARAFAWIALASAAGILVADEVRHPTTPDGVLAYTDITYRRSGGHRARLDIYLPPGPAPPGGRPAVLAIHGGGWYGGSKGGFGRMAARLARHGYAVLAADYRLSRPGAPGWPENFEDMREAVRWTRRHAGDYGIDPDRIAALGASAGGHLAALLGVYPDGPVASEGRRGAHAGSPAVSARVGAVIDFYGPSDLAALRTDAEGPLAMLLGGPPEQFPGRYETASPVAHVSFDDAPMLLIQGGDDRTVPRDQAERLAAALGRAGVSHKLVVLDGVGHGFGFVAGGHDLLPEILAFLDQTWKYEGRERPNRPLPMPRTAPRRSARGPGSTSAAREKPDQEGTRPDRDRGG